MSEINYEKYGEKPEKSEVKKLLSLKCERGSGWLYSIIIAVSILVLVFAFQLLIERMERMGLLH